MRIQQQYEELQKLRKEIDVRLCHTDFEAIKSLILWLAKSEIFQKLKKKETQLMMLDSFCKIWLKEKKRLSDIGIEDDIFFNVRSLKNVEEKYLTIEFGVLRLETQMPQEYYEQVIDNIKIYRVSGIALSEIINNETSKKEENIIKMASMLRENNQLITAIILLENAEKIYPDNQDILLGLADCWQIGQQWGRTLEYLNKVKEPDESIQKRIEGLERIVK